MSVDATGVNFPLRASTDQLARDLQIGQAQFRATTGGMAASAQPATVATEKLTKATKNLARSASRTRGGMGTLRSVLGSLSATAVGARGTLGTMTSALGFMAIGNLASIGILAGIAGVAWLLKTVRKGAKEAAEELEKMYEAAKKALPQYQNLQLATERARAERGIAGAEGELARLQRIGAGGFAEEERAKMRARHGSLGGRGTARTDAQLVQDYNAALEEQARILERNRVILLDVTRRQEEFTGEQGKGSDAAAKAAEELRLAREAFDRLTPGIELLRFKLAAISNIINTTFPTAVSGGLLSPSDFNQGNIGGIGGDLGKEVVRIVQSLRTAEDIVEGQIRTIRQAMAGGLDEEMGKTIIEGLQEGLEKSEHDFTRAGEFIANVLSYSIADAIMSGDIQALFKSAGRSLLGGLLGLGIKAGIGFLTAGPAGAAVGAGSSLVPGGDTQYSVADPGLTMNFTMPPLPANEGVTANADLQKWWREMALTAASQGFRVNFA